MAPMLRQIRGYIVDVTSVSGDLFSEAMLVDTAADGDYGDEIIVRLKSGNDWSPFQTIVRAQSVHVL